MDDKDLDEAISRTRDTIHKSKNFRKHHSARRGSAVNPSPQKTITILLKSLIQGVVPADLAIQCSNLRDMLLQRYEKTNDQQDLFEVIDCAREAARATPRRDADRAKRGDLHEIENLAV
ncbi:hypothetical protein HD806DRAFT_539409 [Xylariaceae sp. AK1471]|nr:hypothetical protein HD806DRAFT_539409 [Xylariaceae sp. AK1471]